MTKVTEIDIEKAADILGVEVYDLVTKFREDAATELERVADRVRRGHPMEGLQRARNLLRVAEVGEKVLMREIEAEDKDSDGAQT